MVRSSINALTEVITLNFYKKKMFRYSGILSGLKEMLVRISGEMEPSTISCTEN